MPERGRGGRFRSRRALRWAVRCVAVALVGYALTGFASSRLAAERGPALTTVVRLGDDAEPLPRVWRRAGVMSVHTERSHDAEGTLEEVARAARAGGVDFVVMGDHPGDWARAGVTSLAPSESRGVLLVGGVELVVQDVGRVLAIGLDSVPRAWQASVDALLQHIDSAAGFVSVIHPRSPRARERWKAVSAHGVHGWEAIDVSELARVRLQDGWAGYHLASFLGGLMMGRGHESLLRLSREGLELPGVLAYDSMRAQAPLTVTAGVNHHPKGRLLGGPFPSYAPFFRTVQNHVLLDAQPAADAAGRWAQIAGALRAGRSFVSLGRGERVDGFRFGAMTAQGWVEMGGTGPAGLEATLRLELPTGARGPLAVRVLRNGLDHGWFEGGPGERLAIPAPAAGVYRIEVYEAGRRVRRWRWNRRPWLLTNSVHLVTPDGDAP